MPALANERHEIFAEELAKGKDAGDAYEIAGYKRNRGNASVLKRNKSILDRVAELQALRVEIEARATQKAIDELSVNRAWVLSRLKENVLRALQAVPVMVNGKPSGEYRYDGAVANRALELLGKEIGLFIAPPPPAPGTNVVVNNFPGVNLANASAETLDELRRLALDSLRSQPGLLEGTPYKVEK